jgi:ATP-dependent RNA helicase RhlE
MFAARGEHPERGHEYHRPAQNKPAHDPWFDRPYVPSIGAPAVPVKKHDEPVASKAKAQIPALFRRSS